MKQSSSTSGTQSCIPSYLKTWLLAAGVYNLLYGAWVVLFPLQWWAFLDLTPPRYIELWQCIGMIVGCYGIGYLVAALDPIRYWPIVLVGLLGKVAGPIGFVGALIKDTLPVDFLWMILLNDLLWWIPFFLILRHTVHYYFGRTSAADPEVVLAATTSQGVTLGSISAERGILLIALRHTGCVFCREALQDLKQALPELTRQGIRPVVLHMSPQSEMEELLKDYGLAQLPHISDPGQDLYRQLGLGMGSPWQLFGPSVWVRGWQAFRDGHRVHWPQGSGFQMPGLFLMVHHEISKSYLHTHAGSRPDLVAFAT